MIFNNIQQIFYISCKVVNSFEGEFDYGNITTDFEKYLQEGWPK
jgi:hypothetical protein